MISPEQSIHTSTTLSSTTASQSAQWGEAYRLAGNYSDAILSFNQAITLRTDYAWALAHRGAARAGMGNFHGAWQDFQQAEQHRYENAAWLHGEKGELCRLWARAIMSNSVSDGAPDLEHGAFKSAVEYLYPGNKEPLDDPGQWPFILMKAAIYQFTESLNKRSMNPWVLAHRGAVHTMRYWIGTPNKRMSQGDPEDFEAGCADFTAACENNCSYGWAYAFWSVLYAVKGDMAQAMDKVAKAQLNGLDRQLSVIRILMELYIYNDNRSDGVQAAWQALQIDSEETFARYFVAEGVSLSGHPEAEIARQRARMALRDARGRILAMEGGLDCLDKKYESAAEKLKELKKNRDLEALSLVSRDPAWRAVRDGQRSEPDNDGSAASKLAEPKDARGLEAFSLVSSDSPSPPEPDNLHGAHAAYKDLFTF